MGTFFWTILLSLAQVPSTWYGGHCIRVMWVPKYLVWGILHQGYVGP